MTAAPLSGVGSRTRGGAGSLATGCRGAHSGSLPRVRILRLVCSGLVLSIAVIAGVAVAPSAARADVTASTALITRPGTLTPLNSGDKTSLYGVNLPAGASCPGDTAHQAYHVFSYLVPRGVSPTVVSFKTGDPSEYFGYIAFGSYFGAANTAVGTGQIVGIPAQFTWSRLTPQDLFARGARSATWEGGVACADSHGVVTDYWNSEIVFTASTADPQGFAWRVVQPSAVSSATRLGPGLGLLVLAILFGVTAFVVSWRTRRPRSEVHHAG
jgi:hypothetical protein